MRGINDSITHSLRALLARYSRTTCRVSLHCRLNVFLFVLCSKSKNIPGRNKKIPEDCVGRKASGREILGLMKDYSAGGATGVSSLVLQLPTSGAKLIVAPSLDKVKV